MNLEKVVFGFFIVLALTLNVDLVVSEIGNHKSYNIWVLYIAIIVNLIATGLKLGDRSQIGAVLLSTSLVTDLHLILAALFWKMAADTSGTIPDPDTMATVITLAIGALVANIISVIMLVVDTLMSRR